MGQPPSAGLGSRGRLPHIPVDEVPFRVLYGWVAHTGDPLIRPSGTFSPAGRRGRWTPPPRGEGAAMRESGRPLPAAAGRGVG